MNIVIPVSDVDRAKRFYGDLGFSLELDYTAGNGFRMIQATLRRCAASFSSIV
jgi:catechol 2,3-dioxygenase-like lactoylglutathione lyase family enzyme